MKLGRIGIAGLALVLIAGCGRGENTPGQPSADERRALDNAAAKLDAQAETFDTSADSLVPADGEAAGNAAVGTPPVANGAAPVVANSSMNGAVPR